MLSRDDIIKILKDSNALMEGHFILTSGLHSGQYIEKFRILEKPRYTEMLCKDIAEFFRKNNVSVVVGPMTGGIILAYEVARQLGVKSIFTERVDGKMKFKRGFKLNEQDRVLIVEDIITTGGSIFEVIEEVNKFKSNIIGLGYLIDRSNGKVKFPIPSHPLLTLNIESYTKDECPFCEAGVTAVKPGSTNKCCYLLFTTIG
ncbi:MAG: orotate phosphoribosyltransferase [Ignavibacteria bacterium]